MLLITAVGMFALVFIVAAVVDTANWFEHRRHLQLQADAAALAGAHSISLPLSSCSNATISAAAHNYGGPDANNPTALYNAQVGGVAASKLHILINSRGYFGDADAADNNGGTPCANSPPNEFCRSATDPTVGAPGIDIKATESDLPWFFGGLVPRINAHARVCLMQETSSANSLPIAVPNPKPKSAAAIFINEGNSNAVLGTAVLNECQNPAPPAPPTCPSGVSLWASGGSDIPIAAQTGVVIAVSGLRPADFSVAGNLATICGQQLTTCFDGSNDPPTVGVNFIRGWTNSGSAVQPNAPLLRDVQLFPGGCPADAYFEAITVNCSVTIAAMVDASLPGGANYSMNVTVLGAGCGKGCDLAKDLAVPPSAECAAVQAGGASGQCWKGSIPISALAGAQPLTVSWQTNQGTINGKACGNGKGCSGTFETGAVIQQAYTANDNPSNNLSGPLARVQILGCTSPTNCPVVDANSLVIGTRTIAVSLDLKGVLQNAQNASDTTALCTFPNGTVYHFACLRVAVNDGGGGGSTQSIDCNNVGPGTGTLENALALGCSPQYTINYGTNPAWAPCPATNALNDATHPEPWQCVALVPGNHANSAIKNGLNRRIFGNATPPSCPAYGAIGHNNWAMFDPNLPGDGFPQGDKRIVGTYLTAYGTFSHTSGRSTTIPVTDFATFYITGYDGSPCTSPGVTDHPDDPIPDRGTIVGHFIKYVDTLNSGGGTIICDPTSFGACVPVMTK
ncbi:MAG: pilus assembly protein TadG-related protein [Gaiellaceae bacterium]